VDTRAIGNAIIELGGGRKQVGETLDLSVGFSDIARTGTELDADTPLAVIHAASEADAQAAERNLLAAVKLADSAPPEQPVIHEILTG
jgi:thymidine phosphorylase